MSTYSPIATQTLGSTATSVQFNNIPQGYTDLICVFNVGASGAANVQVQLNNDTTATYSTLTMYGTGSGSGASGGYANNTLMYTGVAGALPSTISANAILQFNNYSNSTTFKTMLSRYNNAATEVDATISTWRNTSPITSITLSSYSAGYLAGSTFALYGLAGGSAGPKASGGIVTTSGGYAYHTFLTSGGFIPSENITVDYLVVAGGGGAAAGGGGAGGLLSSVTASGGGTSPLASLSLTAGITYPAIVGAGGAGSSSAYVRGGFNGSNSTFNIKTALGGGKGGWSGALVPQISGGSGGGASYSSGSSNYGLGAAGQGFNGGQDTQDNPPYPGAGGGGAGQVGYNPPSGSTAGNGGNGVQITALATPTSTGVSGYYAGGGAGGTYGAATGATGGLGGGGNEGAGVGTINTGSGGGGGANNAPGGAGGSGIVIIRYAI